MTMELAVSPHPIINHSSLDLNTAIPIVSQSSLSQEDDDGMELASSPSPVAPRIRRSPRLSILSLPQPLLSSVKLSASNTHQLKAPLLPPRVDVVPVLKKERVGNKENIVNQPTTTTVKNMRSSRDNTTIPELVAVWNQKQVNVRVIVGKKEVRKPRSKRVLRASLAGPIAAETLTSPPKLLTPTIGESSTPTDQSSTIPSESMLKSLLAETRRELKPDGTPHEPKDRRIYDEGGEEADAADATMDDTLLPNTSSTQPSSPMAAVQQTTPLSSNFSLQRLNERMHHMFPQIRSEKEGQNCLVARLFACFSLDIDAKQNPAPSPGKRPRNNASEASTPILVSLDSIIQVMDSLVQLELAVLHGEQELKVAQRNRRVAFCAYDGSALQPPSDVIEDSHAHKQAELFGLATVMGRLHDLQKKASTTDAVELLHHLVVYLKTVFPSSGHALVCAHSLSHRFLDFPVPRVLKAAERYANDLQQLTVNEWWEKPLTWQCRLADASAQMVRYWLRTELNPVPDRAPCEIYSKQWNLRVCDLVMLHPPEGTALGTAVDDGSLSSIVSNAASHIYYAFGYDWKSWKSRMEEVPDNFFGDSSLVTKGIAPSSSKRRSSGIHLRQYSNHEWYQAGVQLEAATSFLAAANGAQFLYELLAIVVQHPEHEQSWKNTIQQSAISLSMIHRESLQEQDRHLTLLRYAPRALLEQLPILIHHTKQQAAHEFLAQLAKNCLLGQMDATSKRRKRAYQPDLDFLEASWEWCVSHIHFPRVTKYEDDEEEDTES